MTCNEEQRELTVEDEIQHTQREREKSRWYIIKRILLYLFYVWTVKWNKKQIMKNSSWLSRKTTLDPQKKVFKNKTEIGVLNTNFFSRIWILIYKHENMFWKRCTKEGLIDLCLYFPFQKLILSQHYFSSHFPMTHLCHMLTDIPFWMAQGQNELEWAIWHEIPILNWLKKLQGV